MNSIIGQHRLLAKIIFFSILSINALAHVPVFLKEDPTPSSPYVLNRPYKKSIAIYNQFDFPDDVDVYQFEIEEGDLINGTIQILIGTLVPACRPLEKLLTSWAVVGPKQDGFAEGHEVAENDKFQVTEGEGVFFIKNSTQGPIWYEPYTRHYYFYQQRKEIQLAKTGVYKIFVWPSKGLQGDYVFEFGDREIWSLKDILFTLWSYPRLLLENEIKTKNCQTTDLKNTFE